MAFSTRGSSAGSGLSSEINVTLLIDVLLVMLIIFMVIVPFAPVDLEPRSRQLMLAGQLAKMQIVLFLSRLSREPRLFVI